MALQQHMKPLYIRAKVNGIGINKFFIDCRACVNVMPQSLLEKIGNFTTDLAYNNMVLSNNADKIGKSLAVVFMLGTQGVVLED